MRSPDHPRYQYRSEINSSGVLSYRYGGEIRNLLPCERVSDKDLLVGIVAYNRIDARRLIPTHKDRQPIRITLASGQKQELNYAGKSAFLYFEGTPTAEVVGKLVGDSFNRDREREDHLHLSTVGWVEEAGWQVYWTPLPERKHWLHVRLVPNCIIESGRTPTLEEANALKEVFIKAI